ncbi:hypothetical protein K469DRAFT_714789 [Zopfia rhizophila CBS 207.26]|uniref:Uncharacterized protein n=1 Tax=Zopfia rhizophila CBS 207.26 TaxID=1314779 RepID=A0A6A6DLN7_9PEZI|nr:hypothetical protein K469DRAFT_714789 [Zopfia rhizophila CBS 207.26]
MHFAVHRPSHARSTAVASLAAAATFSKRPPRQWLNRDALRHHKPIRLAIIHPVPTRPPQMVTPSDVPGTRHEEASTSSYPDLPLMIQGMSRTSARVSGF